MHANPPRTQCAQHGVKVIKLPWAEAGSRFTALFEVDVDLAGLQLEFDPLHLLRGLDS